MEEVLFIINPTAGGGKARELKTIIEEKMKDYGKGFKIVFTKSPKEATEIAYKSDIKTIVAVGGDGTVTEVARGVINRGYGVLGIVPGGTGNDFIKSMGMKKDLNEAIETIINGKTTKIDICLANGYKFLNIGGIGLDVEVVRTSEKVKNYIRGRFGYILSIFITLLKFKKINVDIEIDGQNFKRNLVLFGTGNGRFYGGGLQMVPSAKVDDGYLHSTIVKDLSNLRIVTIFPEIFKGTHVRHKKYVETFKAKEVKIVSKEELYMNLDGELFLAGKEIQFSLSKDKLELLIP